MKRITFCSACGAATPHGGRRCRACGAPLERELPPPITRDRWRPNWLVVLWLLAALAAAIAVALYATSPT